MAAVGAPGHRVGSLPGVGRGQGWYLRVGFHFDVVFGDEALAAIQLRLVPVLVIFHVENLGQERSREASAQLPSPQLPTAPVQPSHITPKIWEKGLW